MESLKTSFTLRLENSDIILIIDIRKKLKCTDLIYENKPDIQLKIVTAINLNIMIFVRKYIYYVVIVVCMYTKAWKRVVKIPLIGLLKYRLYYKWNC